MFIPNTLHLEDLYVTPDLREELEHRPDCAVDPVAHPLTFRSGRLVLK